MKNTEVNYQIEVEGVILTKEAINQLKAFQDGGFNEELEIDREAISDAVCYLSSLMFRLDDHEIKKTALIMSCLSVVRDHLDGLRKP